jgi:hypothetical protein
MRFTLRFAAQQAKQTKRSGGFLPFGPDYAFIIGGNDELLINDSPKHYKASHIAMLIFQQPVFIISSQVGDSARLRIGKPF